jgi:hypothetical protein
LLSIAHALRSPFAMPPGKLGVTDQTAPSSAYQKDIMFFIWNGFELSFNR